MKIRIIKGVYGHVVNNVTVPKSKKSEPFEVADDIAKGLIKRGIAEVATEKSEAEKPVRYRECLAPAKTEKAKVIDENVNASDTNTTPEDDTKDESPEADNNAPKYSMDNKKEELLKFAEDLGIVIDNPDNITKKQIIELLDDATSDDEEAPEIGDNEGIVD